VGVSGGAGRLAVPRRRSYTETSSHPEQRSAAAEAERPRSEISSVSIRVVVALVIDDVGIEVDHLTPVAIKATITIKATRRE